MMSTPSTKKSIFLNDRIIMYAIVANAAVIFAHGYYPDLLAFYIIDLLFTLFFWIEVVVKVRTWGFKQYWSYGWNKFDFTIIVLSTIAYLQYFAISSSEIFANLLILRIFRIFRTLKSARISHYVKSTQTIMEGIRRGLKAGSVIFIGFFILLFIVSMVSFEIFNDICPEYFKTPMTSIYSTFQLFTIEGWYDIPNSVCDGITSPHKNFYTFLIRAYFVFLLFIGGIMGMSFINSIVVDAMVSDNNDEVLEELKQLRAELGELKQQLDKKTPKDEA